MSVGLEIFRQIGGPGFVLSTGATQLVSWNNGLSFRLPGTRGFVRDRINAVSIRLMPSDTYTVRFSHATFTHDTLVTEVEDVYCDQLQDVFERHTGLSLALCRVHFG
jgi:hypothetical protein